MDMETRQQKIKIDKQEQNDLQQNSSMHVGSGGGGSSSSSSSLMHVTGTQLPKTVGDLLSLKGLSEKYESVLVRLGYEDLEFILSANANELERLSRDTSMLPTDLERLKQAIHLAKSTIQNQTNHSNIQSYCQKVRAAHELPSDSTSRSVASSDVTSGSSSVTTCRALVAVQEHPVQQEHKTQDSLEKQFNRLMLHATDTSISPDDQKQFEKTGSGATYGYMTWKGVKQMLSEVEVKGKTFYDLGSGLGRPVFAAAMLFPSLKKSIGIELSQRRHIQAERVLELMEDGAAKSIVEICAGSMLDYNLRDADIVYISSLCFPKEFLARLGHYLDKQLQKGTIVMSSKEVPMRRGRLDRRPVVAMSWNQQHQLHSYVMEGDPVEAENECQE